MKIRHATYKIMAILLVPVILASLTACHKDSPATTVAVPTPDQTVYQAVKSFINAAQERYTNPLTCGDTLFPASVNGITAEDFLSLDVQSGAVLSINGKPYLYEVVQSGSQPLLTSVNIGDYSVTFSNPNPGVTPTGGARYVRVQAYRGGKLVGESTYVEMILNIVGYSSTLYGQRIGELLVLFTYYKPDCESLSFEKLWLVLWPIPAPSL